MKAKAALLALWKWNRKNGTKPRLCRAKLSSQAGALLNSKPSNRGSFVCLLSRSLSCCEGWSGQCFLCAPGERAIHGLQAGACPEVYPPACLCQWSYFTLSQGNRGGPVCCWPLLHSASLQGKNQQRSLAQNCGATAICQELQVAVPLWQHQAKEPKEDMKHGRSPMRSLGG